MILPTTPIDSFRGVGPKISSALLRLGIRSAGDLLAHLPFRYEDFRSSLPIARLQAKETVTVRGTLELIGSRRSFRRRLTITEGVVRDQTGRLHLLWFNQAYLAKSLKPGQLLVVSGKTEWRQGRLQMTNPHVERLLAEQTHAGRLIPIYPTTEGVSPKFLRSLVRRILPLTETLIDPLPDPIRQREKLLPLGRAYARLHFPEKPSDVRQAQQRLHFDTLLRLQLESVRARKIRQLFPAPVLTFQESRTRSFVQSLPWRLTPSQKKAAWAILRDLERPHPMNRLLQGDVGSGKTVVAALAMLTAAWNGYQSALLAPTELLAEQHYRTLQQFFNGLFPLALLTGGHARRSDRKTATKTGLHLALRRGQLPIVVGTHALLESTVRYQRLGLAVIDEQHRFGVAQRQRFREQASLEGERFPHFLSMTATPIPRTLALTLYSDLDLSSLTELPNNRKPILTSFVAGERKALDARIEQELKAGHQVFVVTPLIEESDALGVRAATATHAEFQTKRFPKQRIGLLHGRLSTRAKELVMKKFLNGETDILVTTAVIEVGIDVPNATVIVIENAERFGYAQLHQFRGRVGRGPDQSYCFLTTDQKQGSAADRLKAFTRLKDGFQVAEADFAQRGPGELRGGRQSGPADMSMDALKDLELITRTRSVAEELLREDPTLERFPGIARSEGDRSVHWE